MVEPQPSQRRIGIGGGSVNDVEPVILEATAQEAHEVGVGLQRHQDCVGAHPPENLTGECANPGPVLQEDSAAAPVDLRQDMVDEET
ncbi:MAG: hypothetical protein QOK27_1274 [Gemmatimonadales bacterium]|nr:hypothetical protein [Gemmatimonadales bacterium]